MTPFTLHPTERPVMPLVRRTGSISRSQRMLRNLLVVTAAACASAPLVVAAANGPLDSSTSRQYDIASGPLGRTLASIAASSGLAFSFEPTLTAGLISPAVNGTFTLRQAMDRLLSGSGLAMVARSDGSYTLQRNAPGEPASMPAVTVTGETGRRDATENTGLYTSGESNNTTRMGLTQRETPQSISVISRQQIDDQNLKTLDDVLGQTPGIVADRIDERVIYTSRGFELNTMIDGVPTLAYTSVAGESSMLNTAVYDRVEVLRGAAGLLNSVGAPGGSINLVRKRPTAEFAGSVTAGAGSWNRYLTEVDLRSKLDESGSVRGRIVASHAAGDSFITGKSRRDDTIYGIVETDLTANTLLTTGFEYQNTHIKGANFGQAPLFYSDGSLTHFSRSYNSSTPWSMWDMSTQRAFVNLDHRFANDWRVVAEAAQMKNERRRYSGDLWLYPSEVDRDTGQALLALGKNPARGTNKSLDVYATGPFQLWGQTHQASVGVNLNHYTNSVDIYNAINDVNDLRPVNIFDLGAVPKPSFDFHALRFGTETEQQSLYGATRLKLADPLAVLVGARVSWYRSTDWQRSWTDGSNGVRMNADPTKERGVFTPYAGIVYDVSKNYSVYASYTDIFQPNTVRDSSNKVLGPRRGNSTEVGIKGEHWDGALNTSLALFRSQEDNVPVEDPLGTPLPDGSAPYRAVKGARSQGYELTASGQIMPGWQVMAGYTYHAKRDSDKNLLNPSYPRRLLRIATSYRLPGDWNQLTIGANVRFQSDIYFDDYYGLGRARQGGLTLLGLMARYDFTRQLSATLNIDNLSDKRYYAGLGGYNGYTYGNPRNAFLRVRYQF